MSGNPGIYSAAELEHLSLSLSQIEDWLRQDCTARHADDMADVVRKAWTVIDDLYDAQWEAESGQTEQTRSAEPDPARPGGQAAEPGIMPGVRQGALRDEAGRQGRRSAASGCGWPAAAPGVPVRGLLAPHLAGHRDDDDAPGERPGR